VNAIVSLLAVCASGLIVWAAGGLSPAGQRWLGLLRARQWRAVFSAAFALSASAGVTLSTSDHSHQLVTYVLWYGSAAVALLGCVVTTFALERSEGAEATPGEHAHPPSVPCPNRGCGPRQMNVRSRSGRHAFYECPRCHRSARATFSDGALVKLAIAGGGVLLGAQLEHFLSFDHSAPLGVLDATAGVLEQL
jgi:hypothetical protein